MRYSELTLVLLAVKTVVFGYLVWKLGNGTVKIPANVMFWLCQVPLTAGPVVAVAFGPWWYVLLIPEPRRWNVTLVAAAMILNAASAWGARRVIQRERRYR